MILALALALGAAIPPPDILFDCQVEQRLPEGGEARSHRVALFYPRGAASGAGKGDRRLDVVDPDRVLDFPRMSPVLLFAVGVARNGGYPPSIRIDFPPSTGPGPHGETWEPLDGGGFFDTKIDWRNHTASVSLGRRAKQIGWSADGPVAKRYDGACTLRTGRSAWAAFKGINQ
ncbi:hypothetical protein OF829_11350 [Sphingomonas sp. LB-2]|uniref:hypothetical protein n=1 Tax=Sphingomonas caeni TaxID=2984949 RepID=UPI00222E611E|nr:hypothetical protein [Sphingomonas caeni]MCW3847836.1 hypothetical protein [Sphingomonas caeni]